MHTLKGKWVALSLVSGCAIGLSGPAHPTDRSAPANLVERNMPEHPSPEVPLQEALGVFLDGDNLPESGIARSEELSIATAGADAAGPETPPGFPDWVAVDSTVLEQMRGGFDIAPGLRVTFGIERRVNLNGLLQTATRIEVPDAAKLIQQTPSPGVAATRALPGQAVPAAATGGTAQPASAAVPAGMTSPIAPTAAAATAVAPPAVNLVNGGTALIQNGPGNLFSSAALPQGAVGTFIQNSVNNQTIQSLTIINATTNSLELLKGANLQSTLFDALTQSAGVR